MIRVLVVIFTICVFRLSEAAGSSFHAHGCLMACVEAFPGLRRSIEGLLAVGAPSVLWVIFVPGAMVGPEMRCGSPLAVSFAGWVGLRFAWTFAAWSVERQAFLLGGDPRSGSCRNARIRFSGSRSGWGGCCVVKQGSYLRHTVVMYRAQWECSHPGGRQRGGRAKQTRGANQFQ